MRLNIRTVFHWAVTSPSLVQIVPVEFLSDEQAARNGRFAADPTPKHLARYFFLSEANLALITECRRDHNKRCTRPR
ncbi:DUF4158 domain-containing protein [Deinococcus aquatilis]|uniref:DUF4158 domain-containing protein n=1 Tax=Deinococcus aquatilis TaxID=519440 RepID=UPI0009FCA33F